MDLISNLPKEMKHRIICLLSETEAVRASILSKSWKLAWDSRPILVFSEENNRPGVGGSSSFADFLDQSLQRYSEKQVSVEELRVFMDPSPSPETLNAVSRWILFAAKTNLRVLRLSIPNLFATNNLLDALSSDTLTTLHLSGCELTLGPNRNWRLPRLRSLSLVDMTLDSAAVQEFVSACPSLEQFELFCHSTGMGGLELSGIGNLKRFKVELYWDFCKISLQRASSLESFTCYGDTANFVGALVSEIKLEGCEASLKELRMSDIDVSTEWVRSQITKFRGLKVLALKNIQGLATLKISSTELTELVLLHLEDLGSDPEIYAPNLRKLEIRGRKCVFNPHVTSRSLESVNSEFCFATDADHKTDVLDKLKELLYKISHINNVVVVFSCQVPKIAIVHEGHSDNLLDIVGDLCDWMSCVRVIISSDRNWIRHVVSPLWTDSIYIASSLDNNCNHLKEYLLNELTFVRRSRYDVPYNHHWQYVRSIAMETENDRSELGGDVDTKHALLEVYRLSSFRLTRFALCWSPFNSFFEPRRPWYFVD